MGKAVVGVALRNEAKSLRDALDADVIAGVLRGLWNGSITIIKQDDRIIQININEVFELNERCRNNYRLDSAIIPK